MGGVFLVLTKFFIDQGSDYLWWDGSKDISHPGTGRISPEVSFHLCNRLWQLGRSLEGSFFPLTLLCSSIDLVFINECTLF